MGIVDYINEKKKQQVRQARMEDAKRIGLGVLIGGLVGGVGGLLFAPKSGEETRADIADAAKHAAGTVKAKSDELVDKARQLYDEHIGEKLTNIRPVAEDVEEDVKDTAKKVSRTVKEGAKDVKKDAKEEK